MKKTTTFINLKSALDEYDIKKSLMFLLVCLVGITEIQAQTGSLKVNADNEFVQIGYGDTYKALTFGGNTHATQVNGQIGVEYFNGGMNFFKPWPSWNAGNYKLFIADYQGRVGIGKWPAYKLDVNGDIATYGTYRIYSDKNLKSNINLLNGKQCLEKIKNINSYSYNYNTKELPITYENIDPNLEISDIKEKTMKADLDRKMEYDNKTD